MFWWVGGDSRPVSVESVGEVGQVGGGELPGGLLRGLVVTGFEGSEPFGDDVGIIELEGGHPHA